jgi:hypothetical protein
MAKHPPLFYFRLRSILNCKSAERRAQLFLGSMPCVAILVTEYCAPAPRIVRGNRYDHARKPTHALALEPRRTGKNGHRASRERKQETERYSRRSFRNDSPQYRARVRVIVEKSLESSKSELGNTSPKSQSLNTEQRNTACNSLKGAYHRLANRQFR